jgi:glycosyltransferase involved in cell wall biosynthesis
MITTFYPPYNYGGDGIFVHRLSNELARGGHKVDVIHCMDAYRLGGGMPSGGYRDHPNVTVHGLKSRFGFLSPLATHQTGRPLFKADRIREILEKGFDVVHYHNISLVGGPKILEYGEGIKLYTMLEYWLVCPTNVLLRFNRAPCMRPLCFSCSLTYKRPPQLWRYLGLMGTAVKHVDAFIAPSLFSKEIHRKMGLDIPIVHIPYFIPSEGGAPAKSEMPLTPVTGKPYFLFVGRLEKLKGLHTIIPLFRQFDKAWLLVAGTGSEESCLKRLAEGTENIWFLGHVAGCQLRDLYRKAVAVVVPSICYDAAPLVILESFKEKTPAIVRNLGGMPEIIEESGAGFVYDDNDGLLSAMNRLLDEPSLRQSLGHKGYVAFERKWTAEAHLKGYFGLIEAIAKNRNRPLAQFTSQS